MLNPEQRESLRQVLIKAYIEEQEDTYKSSTADGPLQLSCDVHADITHSYITPYLDNFEAFRRANEANPPSDEDDRIIEATEEVAWNIMMEVEQELLQEMIDHLKKQLESINLL